MKRTIILLLILFIPIKLFSAISASSVFYASHDALVKMCSMRGLDTFGEDDELRARLYEYENIEAYSEVIDSESQNESDGDNSQIRVESAESLSRVGNSIVISGNARVSFTSSENEKKSLSATTIIIDQENRRLTALENVSYSDPNGAGAISDMSADILTLFWKDQTLYVTGASTLSDREVEGEDVTFYTQGESLTYLPEGGLLYDDGYLTTDPEKRYSSITASQIAILPGNDMFITNAYVSVGRVPFLWLPFFVFPGSRILGNPAFGFSSSHGAFLNTTFELLGSYPDISTSLGTFSFASLFTSGKSTGTQIQGFYYGDETAQTSTAQSWARETNSYIALMADAFSGFNVSMNNARMRTGGLHLGLKSSINLFKSTFKINVFDGVGLSSPAYSGGLNIRWYGQNTIEYSNYGLNINASFPFYSDPYVLIDFGNRLTGFSMDAIMSPNSIEFPSTYSSSITSFQRSLKLSYNLPSQYRNQFVSSFSISDLSLISYYTWITHQTGQNGARDINNEYILDRLLLPILQASISGSLYDIGTTRTISYESDPEEAVNESEKHLLSDPLLMPLYKESVSTPSDRTENYSSSLTYSITESLQYGDDYSYGRINSNSFSSNTAARFTLSAKFADYFTLTDTLSPSFNYQRNTSYAYSLTDTQETLTTTSNLLMNNDLSISIPFLGITYSLSTRLLNTKNVDVYYPVGRHENTFTTFSPSWNVDTITQHKISFSKAFDTDFGTFTPSISYTIAPLIGSLSPSIGYKYGNFAAAFSWRFNENRDRPFSLDTDLMSLSLGYNGTYVTFSSAFSYQTRDYDKLKFWDPFSLNASLSLRTKDNKFSITEYIEYSYLNPTYNINNYFNAIRTTINIPFVSLALNWKTQEGSGNVEFNDLSLNLNLETQKFQFWKGRIYLALGLTSSFRFNAINKQNSSFQISPSITFSIAEFVDFTFSVSSYNNSFDSYFDRNGNFDFMELLRDLGRSFDLFGGGIYNTHFLMRSISLTMVHYMKDWNLNASLTTQVVRNGYTYDFVPTLSIYLSWKTLPELKVDQKWERSNGEWVNRNSNSSLFNW